MPIKRRHLRPHVMDAPARGHAKQLAEQWRAAGLTVDVVEYLGTHAEAGGYTLTARNDSSVLSCRCQSWLAHTWPWRRRPVWTIAVSTRATPATGARLREVGTTAAWDHHAAWARVQRWIDGAGSLAPTLDKALAALN